MQLMALDTSCQDSHFSAWDITRDRQYTQAPQLHEGSKRQLVHGVVSDKEVVQVLETDMRPICIPVNTCQISG